MQGRLRDLYELDCHVAPPYTAPSNIAFSAQFGQSFDLWHQRMAHINKRALRYLVSNQLVTGMDLHTSGSLGPCDGCALGKHPQAPFPVKAS